jgi:D-glycerate 3-kinase
MATFEQHLGLDPADPITSRLASAAAPQGLGARGGWRPLAAAVARSLMPDAAVPARARLWPPWSEVPLPLVFGIAGAQGSGKTTLARELERCLLAAGARVAACSLDDFYLSRNRRRELAADVHPLLATRGVPGTHDLTLLNQVIDDLGTAGSVRLPVFDKGADDLLPAAQWRRVSAPLDVLVLEGWCLGAVPQAPAALHEPVNTLEACEDADERWRRFANDALAGRYAALWRRLHGLIFLRVPDMDAVLRWRTEQELALPADRRMDAAGLERFVAHYERITRSMLTTPPPAARLVVSLDDSHAVAALQHSESVQR